MMGVWGISICPQIEPGLVRLRLTARRMHDEGIDPIQAFLRAQPQFARVSELAVVAY